MLFENETKKGNEFFGRDEFSNSVIVKSEKNLTGKIKEVKVKVGDKVLFGKWSGTEVKMNGEDYLIMKESDIMGIITSGKKK